MAYLCYRICYDGLHQSQCYTTTTKTDGLYAGINTISVSEFSENRLMSIARIIPVFIGSASTVGETISVNFVGRWCCLWRNRAAPSPCHPFIALSSDRITMSSLGVTQLQRAREFISTLGAYQYDSLANILSENFTHRFLPTSLNGMGMPVRNTQEFLDHLKEVKLAIEEFNVS